MFLYQSLFAVSRFNDSHGMLGLVVVAVWQTFQFQVVQVIASVEKRDCTLELVGNFFVGLNLFAGFFVVADAWHSVCRLPMGNRDCVTYRGRELL